MSHDHAPPTMGRAFAIGIALNLIFIVVEATYGILGHSLALLSDAGHNLGDVFGLLVAWLATFVARRKPSKRHTYGYGRASILAALANSGLLLFATGAIVWEAVGRLRHPEPVEGMTLVVVAAIGVVINAGSALLFRAGSKGDLNVRAAFVHLAADALVSVGVIIAGILIRFTGWTWLDPATSLALSVVICVTTWSLLRDGVNLAMDAVPADINPDEVKAFLAAQPTVVSVGHLHIWAMSTTKTAMTVVLHTTWWPEPKLLPSLREALEHKFHIQHATFEIEVRESQDEERS